MSVAVLLIAHGSRRDEANEDARFVAEQIRADGLYCLVQTCFLELAEPDIPAGALRCVDSGAEKILILPYFLSPGRHVREHLREARHRLAKLHPGVQWVLCEPLGRHPLLVEIVRERLEAGQRTVD
jgi:sirohydrochlorin ferrochelatase